MDTGDDAKASSEDAPCNDGEKRDDGNREASMESLLETLLARLDGLEAAMKSQHDVMLSVLQPLIDCTVANEKEKSSGIITLDDKGLYRDGGGETYGGSSHETATRVSSTDKKDINGRQNANNILTERGTNHAHHNENFRDLRKHKSEDVGRLRTIPEDGRLPTIRTRPTGQTESSKQDLTKVTASLQHRSGPPSRSELKRRKAAFVARSTSSKDQKPYLALVAAKRQAEISAEAARRAQEEEDDDSWGLLAYIILIIFGALALIGGAAALAITKHMARDVKLNSNGQAEL